MITRRFSGFTQGTPGPFSAGPQRSRGFAILVVLWVLVLIGFLAAQVVAAGRTQLRIAGNLYANAAAEAALEGGINEAIFRLCDPRPDQAWQLDGSRHEVAVGHSRIVLRIENEAARINPNFASPTVLEGLLRATGSDAETAGRLATAIAEWVGAAAGRPTEKIAADYVAAGLDYTPPREPMQSLNELVRVLGMTPEVLAAIRPHLTLYGPPTPDLDAADPAVAAALSPASGQTAIPNRGRAITTPRGGFITARITATAHGPENAEVIRMAVVRIPTAAPQRSVILAWGSSIE